jgi:hypothetical protein
MASVSLRPCSAITTPTRRSGQRFTCGGRVVYAVDDSPNLVRQARELTQERISLGVVERGEAGRRQAVPYFLAVLRGLADQHR